jgi:hypothetical protein
MTNETKQYADLMQQGQEAVLAAVEAWTKTMQDVYTSLPATGGEFDLNESVDKMYDFTEKVLELQRDFTKKLISTSTDTVKAGVNEAAKFNQTS